MPAKKKTATAGESGENENTGESGENENTGESGGIEYARKIAPKMFSEKVVPKIEARVGGIVRQCETVETPYGESVRFDGDFACITHEGKQIKSSRCFLPKIATENLVTAMDQQEDGEPLEFAFRIGTVEDKSTKTGYAWVMKPIHSPKAGEDRALQLLAPPE